jgi:intracellular sulfur oxidation DsrE/DsrF family protein
MASSLPISILIALATHGIQPKNHRVVFEVNVPGAMQYQGVLGNIENLRKAFAPEGVQVEVVCRGEGLKMMVSKDNRLADRIRKVQKTGVVFAACNNTMRAMNIKRDQLFPFAKVVDAGIAEVVRKQEAGWSYIKAGY